MKMKPGSQIARARNILVFMGLFCRITCILYYLYKNGFKPERLQALLVYHRNNSGCKFYCPIFLIFSLIANTEPSQSLIVIGLPPFRPFQLHIVKLIDNITVEDEAPFKKSRQG